MTPQIANSIRTSAVPALQWFKTRVFGGPQFGAILSALHAAVFFGFSYVGMTLVTGWAQQIATALGAAERQ